MTSDAHTGKKVSVELTGSAKGPVPTPTATATATATATSTPTATPTVVAIITTFAGSGRHLLGVGGPATSVNLGYVTGGAFDSAGNLYISDLQNNVVVKVTQSGTLTIAVGTGGVGDYTGDGGLAVNATLNSPGPLAFDLAGNLYIADEVNFVVRKVTPAGVISTFAGKPSGGSSGVDGDPATTVFIHTPSGLACDAAGNVYISDGIGSVVRKVRTDGTIVTVAGKLMDTHRWLSRLLG